jgi:hypothetical protein
VEQALLGLGNGAILHASPHTTIRRLWIDRSIKPA